MAHNMAMRTRRPAFPHTRNFSPVLLFFLFWKMRTDRAPSYPTRNHPRRQTSTTASCDTREIQVRQVKRIAARVGSQGISGGKTHPFVQIFANRPTSLPSRSPLSSERRFTHNPVPVGPGGISAPNSIRVMFKRCSNLKSLPEWPYSGPLTKRGREMGGVPDELSEVKRTGSYCSCGGNGI